MRRLLLVAAACAVLGVGVAGVSSARSPDPKLMVLRLSDVPVGFGLVNGYYADNTRAAKENPWVSLADFSRWGRIIGYGAEYQRSSSVGLVDIVSRASTYRTALGAGRSLHDTYRFLNQQRQFVQGIDGPNDDWKRLAHVPLHDEVIRSHAARLHRRLAVENGQGGRDRRRNPCDGATGDPGRSRAQASLSRRS